MKNLLIVVDYQKDFVDGSLGFPGAEGLDQRIAEKIRAYRERGDDVVFTLDTHADNYDETLEGRNLPVRHCIEGSPGWGLYGETARAFAQGDRVFKKPTFPSRELADWLAGKPYGRIELVGLVSHICVLSNAVMAKAALPEAEIAVDAACTASYDPVLHEKALDILEGLQIRVVNR
jgi:nicotinamidase/pyrazinamidase